MKDAADDLPVGAFRGNEDFEIFERPTQEYVAVCSSVELVGSLGANNANKGRCMNTAAYDANRMLNILYHGLPTNLLLRPRSPW